MSKPLFGLIALLVILDQATKWLATGNLDFQQIFEVIPFFSLYLTHNTGVAFSMLNWMGSWGLVAMTAVIICLMFYLWSKVPKTQALANLGFAMVISGAIGNLIDRAWLGYVVDFFLVHTQTWSFAVFNVADSFITLGAVAIIGQELLNYRNSKQPPPETQS